MIEIHHGDADVVASTGPRAGQRPPTYLPAKVATGRRPTPTQSERAEAGIRTRTLPHRRRGRSGSWSASARRSASSLRLM